MIRRVGPGHTAVLARPPIPPATPNPIPVETSTIPLAPTRPFAVGPFGNRISRAYAPTLEQPANQPRFEANVDNGTKPPGRFVGPIGRGPFGGLALAPWQWSRPGSQPDLPPSPPSRGRNAGDPLVPREAVADPRIRRHTETVSTILNSLILKGRVEFLGGAEWDLNVMPWTESRSPGVNDDSSVGVRQGDFWLDTANGALYVCFGANVGSAVWVRIGGGLTGTFP